MRNPLSDAALTREDVRTGVRFIWYKPGDPSSVKRGVFLSGPYNPDDQDTIVELMVDGNGGPHNVDLCTLGITTNRQGIWGKSLCVADDSESTPDEE